MFLSEKDESSFIGWNFGEDDIVLLQRILPTICLKAQSTREKHEGKNSCLLVLLCYHEVSLRDSIPKLLGRCFRPW